MGTCRSPQAISDTDGVQSTASGLSRFLTYVLECIYNYRAPREANFLGPWLKSQVKAGSDALSSVLSCEGVEATARAKNSCYPQRHGTGSACVRSAVSIGKANCAYWTDLAVTGDTVKPLYSDAWRQWTRSGHVQGHLMRITLPFGPALQSCPGANKVHLGTAVTGRKN